MAAKKVGANKSGLHPGRGRVSRREDVLRAALALFARKGYAETSTRDICAELGLARSAMYHYFKNKEEILFKIEIQAMTEMQEGLDAVLARMNGTPALDRLAAAVRFTFQCAIDRRTEWRTLADNVRSLREKSFRKEIVARRDHYEQQIRTIIEEGARAKFCSVGNPKLATFNIFGIAEGICGWYQPGGPLKATDIIDFNVEFILRAIVADEQLAASVASKSVLPKLESRASSPTAGRQRPVT